MPSVAGTVGALSRMLTGMVTMGAYRAVLGCAKPAASMATEPPPHTQVAVDIKPLQQLDSIVHVVSLGDREEGACCEQTGKGCQGMAPLHKGSRCTQAEGEKCIWLATVHAWPGDTAQ